MARRKRVVPVGVPQHFIQRGNNRHACCSSTSDMKAYINWLRVYASEYDVEIHAWVLMTNHTDILCTPKTKNGVSKMPSEQVWSQILRNTHGPATSAMLWVKKADY